MTSWFKRKAICVVATVLFAGSFSGCATVTDNDATAAAISVLAMEKPVYLTLAPSFFPQQALHCGPAALAMVMADLGYAVTPEKIAPLAFLPGRQGTLQLELVGAARRFGGFAAPVAPRLDALLTEVSSGTSPIVLLNLGLNWAARWHYATVIGYDLNKNTITLRSGLDAKQVMSLFTFRHVWHRAGNWAFSVHKPGELPTTATQHDLVKSALAFERVNPGAPALAGWQSIADRWPDNKTALIGVGNQSYAVGKLFRARAAFQQAVATDPKSAAAWNNLAVVLTDLGDLAAADTALAQVESLEGGNQPQIMQTRKALRRAKQNRAR